MPATSRSTTTTRPTTRSPEAHPGARAGRVSRASGPIKRLAPSTSTSGSPRPEVRRAPRPMSVVVGVDLGTGAARAVAIDADGAVVADARVPYTGVRAWAPGHADPEAWRASTA